MGWFFDEYTKYEGFSPGVVRPITLQNDTILVAMPIISRKK